MKNKVKIATIYFFIFYELKTKKFVFLSMKLRKKCLYSDFFGLNSVRMWENTDQKNSEY